MSSKTALITGASSGIGKEFATIFAREQYHLVLVARNKEKLHAVAATLKKQFDIEVTVVSKDLSLPKSPHDVFNICKDKGIHVDVLVNNAGFGLSGLFKDIDLHKELNMIDLNVKTLTALTKLFLPAMIAKNNGKILNVASTAAFQPGPLMATYFATKAYVLHFSEAIAEELRTTGVKVTALCPGPTVTGFQGRAHQSGVKRENTLTATQVAQIGYDGLMSGKTVVVPGFKNKFFAWVNRISTRDMTTRITKNIMENMIGTSH